MRKQEPGAAVHRSARDTCSAFSRKAVAPGFLPHRPGTSEPLALRPSAARDRSAFAVAIWIKAGQRSDFPRRVRDPRKWHDAERPSNARQQQLFFRSIRAPKLTLTQVSRTETIVPPANVARPYAYRCTDRSWLTHFIATRIAPSVETWLPAAWSANSITWLGFLLMWVLLAVCVFLCPPEPAPRLCAYLGRVALELLHSRSRGTVRGPAADSPVPHG